MVFSSIVFLFVFLPCVILAYYNPFFKSRSFKNVLLLLASLGFYAWGETLFVFIMLFSICFNYGIALAMDKSTGAKKIWLGISLVWNLSLLFVFKYMGFIIENISALMPSLNLPAIKIVLPIGISFFTFQIMSYVFDVYYKKVTVQKNILDLDLYISFFPQLIAGPIVRYNSIAAQIRQRTESRELFAGGLQRFVVGLSKKCLLSNMVALFADYVFKQDVAALSASGAWIGAVAYTFQIYFDFSGYSDMAIGLGKMFGFHFEENFNYPYIASSVTDFWRRWHISLSAWFRDYVYIPLGGNRCLALRQAMNMLAVWAFTGIWHGAAWTFWFWGIYYFILLFIEKNCILKLIESSKVAKIAWRVMTLLLVILGWVIFRSPSLAFAFSYIKRMFISCMCTGESLPSNCTLIFILCTLASLPVVPFIKNRIGKNLKPAAGVLQVVLFVLCICCVVGGAYSPFIYFNF